MKLQCSSEGELFSNCISEIYKLFLEENFLPVKETLQFGYVFYFTYFLQDYHSSLQKYAHFF